jgi:hypothetical protein
MKIVKIEGNLWELTPFQDIYDDVEGENFKNINLFLIKDKISAISFLRTYADYKIRSKAKVVVQVREHEFYIYTVYYGKNGFYVLIKNKKYFLKDMEIADNIQHE